MNQNETEKMLELVRDYDIMWAECIRLRAQVNAYEQIIQGYQGGLDTQGKVPKVVVKATRG